MKGEYQQRAEARAAIFAGEAAKDLNIEKRAEVIHEGRRVRIRTIEFNRDQAILLPLRNGFPIHAKDRVTPVFCLYAENGMRVGHVIKLRDYGLRVFFESAAPAGDYFFYTSTTVGRA